MKTLDDILSGQEGKAMSRYDVVEFKLPNCELTGNKETVEAESPKEALKEFFKVHKVPKKEQTKSRTDLFWYPQGRKAGNMGWTALKIRTKT
jgi:hypothetical protein